MTLNVATEPNAWRVVAGPESVMQFVGTRRPAIFMWTADRSGRMHLGDVVLIYGTKRLQSYAAVARACSVPRENDRARRRDKNPDWWIYLQVQPFGEPIPRALVEAQAFAAPEGSGVKTPAGSGCNRVSPKAIRGFLDLLRDHDPKAARRMETWLVGKGTYPKGLDMDELRYADWDPPERQSPEELKLSRRIAAQLVRSKRFHYLTNDDAAYRRPTTDPAGLSLEHPIADDGGRGSADIVLVDRQASPPTLLVVEVKLRATLAPNRNPVPQVRRYRAALERAYSGWRVNAVVVAESFQDEVLSQAEAQRVPHYVCSPTTGRLSPEL